jgi:predicted P-loop ATPase
LSALRWDGTARVHNLFIKYFNAALLPQEQVPLGELSPRDKLIAYLEHIGRCFAIGAVARIMRPGCKLDNVPVPVSDEGFNKSRAWAALCPDPSWFSDDLSPDLVHRDTKESLVGKWIIELSEMPHARKEVERVKAFFSRQTDRYRRAYDRSSQDHPRSCAFAGTSNDLELISVTGNRRWWPFEVAGPIDIDRIARDRDQLWAEPVDLYRQDASWWLKPEIETLAVEQQEAFEEADVWDDKIAEWTVMQSGPFTLVDVFKGSLGVMDAALISKADENRAARCLKRLRYRRRRTTVAGQRAYRWTKK